MFEKNNREASFLVIGVNIESSDQFKELSLRTQERMRLENNPIERDKTVPYPDK